MCQSHKWWLRTVASNKKVRVPIPFWLFLMFCHCPTVRHKGVTVDNEGMLPLGIHRMWNSNSVWFLLHLTHFPKALGFEVQCFIQVYLLDNGSPNIWSSQQWKSCGVVSHAFKCACMHQLHPKPSFIPLYYTTQHCEDCHIVDKCVPAHGRPWAFAYSFASRCAFLFLKHKGKG